VIALVALASLAGVPLTGGAITRWVYYRSLLAQGSSAALIVSLLADTLLVAALWAAAILILRQRDRLRITPTGILPMVVLLLALVISGVAPGAVLRTAGIERPPADPISFWGLGLVYVLPWLIGSWLARVGRKVGDFAALLFRGFELDWLYSIAGWVGQRATSAIRWLGLVGEGEGWWGWTLIILALGIMFLSIR
jgi:hypothetical protein